MLTLSRRICGLISTISRVMTLPGGTPGNHFMGQVIPTEEVQKAADFIRSKIRHTDISIGVVCGTGLGKLADGIDDADVIPYSDIPGFVTSTDIRYNCSKSMPRATNFALSFMIVLATILQAGSSHFRRYANNETWTCGLEDETYQTEEMCQKVCTQKGSCVTCIKHWDSQCPFRQLHVWELTLYKALGGFGVLAFLLIVVSCLIVDCKDRRSQGRMPNGVNGESSEPLEDYSPCVPSCRSIPTISDTDEDRIRLDPPSYGTAVGHVGKSLAAPSSEGAPPSYKSGPLHSSTDTNRQVDSTVLDSEPRGTPDEPAPRLHGVVAISDTTPRDDRTRSQVDSYDVFGPTERNQE